MCVYFHPTDLYVGRRALLNPFLGTTVILWEFAGDWEEESDFPSRKVAPTSAASPWVRVR